MSDSTAPTQSRFVIHHGAEGWLRVTGPERQRWLQGITTANLAGLDQGAFWGLFLDRTGKIRHEVIGIVEPTAVLLFSLSHGLKKLHQYLDSMLVMEDVELEIEPETSLWSLHGAAEDASLGREKALASGTLSWVTRCDGVFAVRIADEQDWLALLRGSGVAPESQTAWDTLRIAAGVPRWGSDYTDQDTPHHAGLFGRAVARDKGCYVGQEVVCKVEMRGNVAQRVAHLVLDSADGVSMGTPVALKTSREVVGRVTSVSPESLGSRVHALARVKTASLQPQTEFVVGPTFARLKDENLSV